MSEDSWSLEVIRQVWEPPWSTPGPCPYHYPLTPACRQSSAQYDFAGPLAGWSCQTRRRAVAQDRLSVRSTSALTPAGV